MGYCTGQGVGGVTWGLVSLSADQGGRGWLAFGQRNRNPQPFRRACISKFLQQKGSLFLQWVVFG